MAVSDTVIEEMERKILRYRTYEIPPQDLQRWVRHLVNTVQPQLDELAALRASMSTKPKQPIAKVPA